MGYIKWGNAQWASNDAGKDNTYVRPSVKDGGGEGYYATRAGALPRGMLLATV